MGFGQYLAIDAIGELFAAGIGEGAGAGFDLLAEDRENEKEAAEELAEAQKELAEAEENF